MTHDRKPWSKAKPYCGNAGYVASLKCRLPGWIVIYDRNALPDFDGDQRWILMHEPSGRYVAGGSLAVARHNMKGIARARTRERAAEFADILPPRDN